MPERTTTSTLNVPVDKLLEDAEETGHLHLAGRKISIFPPTASSFDLSDVIEMDLSENRFIELPELVNCMASLEKLMCYNNVLRIVPKLTDLQALVHLDLSRNHISELPEHVWRLPLKTLNISHNRLFELPEEMSELSTLMDLDLCGNEIACLPESIGHLINLRDLNVRRNRLAELPESLTSMKLKRLDISVNRICHLPLTMIKMTSLMTLILNDNPLILPPTSVCIRGRVHIFKYLKEELDRANGKEDPSRRPVKRDQSRASRLRQREIKTASMPSGFNPAPRASRTLEEEFASVADRHGFKGWSTGNERPPNGTADRSKPSAQPSNAHDYAVLEPLALGEGQTNGDTDDITPVSSPTLDRHNSGEAVDAPSTTTTTTSTASATASTKPAKSTTTTTTKATGTKVKAATSASSPSTSKSATSTSKATKTAGKTTVSGASSAGASKSSSKSPSIGRSGTLKSSTAAGGKTGTGKSTTSPPTKRPGATTKTGSSPPTTSAGKVSPRVAKASSTAATGKSSSSPKVSRPTSATAKSTPSGSTTSAAYRPVGKKPPLSAKPSAELSAKMTTKKRLEMEWMEKQKEEERRAIERQRDIVQRRQLHERELVERNREQVHRRVSATDTLEKQPRHSKAVDLEQQEKERVERVEQMATAEATRQNWHQREKSGGGKGDGASGAGTKRDSTVSAGSLDGDGVFSEPTSGASSPKGAAKNAGSRTSSRATSSSSASSGDFSERSRPAKDRQFTVRRTEREAKRDFDTLDNIRKLVESVMKTPLGDDLVEALSDGVVLCNLVNQLCPNAIAVIYTPPHRARGGGEVGKLSMLKSVKNVDSFIMGCKKVGLDTGLVCSPADILEMKDPLHVYITVRAIINQCSDSQEAVSV